MIVTAAVGIFWVAHNAVMGQFDPSRFSETYAAV